MAVFQHGDVFAGFMIVRLLGAGRVAEVYEVQTRRGERRALKILKEDAPLTAKLHARLVQEGDILATIEHLNVVRFFGAGVEKGRVWLLIELVDGMDLGRLRLEAGGVLPIARAVRLVRQACQGVAAAHERNFIHRDIRPGNILITRDDTAKVADFGSAKITHYGVQTTNDQIIVPGLYMAPEILVKGRAEQRSDVFSMALVLYELVAGVHAIGHGPGSIVKLTLLQGSRDAAPLAAPGREIPRDLAFVVDQGLSRDPARRPTMARMVYDLGLVLEWLKLPLRAIVRSLPVPNNDDRLAPTQPAMAAFDPAACATSAGGEEGRSAVLPPEAPAAPAERTAIVPTWRSPQEPAPVRAPLAKTMPMEAVEAPADRGSTAVPVARPTAASVSGKRRGLGLAIGVAGALLVGALAAVGWVIAGRGGGGGEVANGAGSATAPAAPAPALPAAPSASAAVSASGSAPAVSAPAASASAPHPKPAAPPGHRRSAPRTRLPFP